MSFLPENELKDPVETPRVFVVFGESMHGKTYFASEFPNPVIFNTDDNAKAISTPSQELYNGVTKVVNGEEKELSAFEYMAGAIDELLRRDDHGFETVVIDTTEDFFFMIQEALAENHNREFFSDIPHGVGWFKYRSLYTQFVLALKKLAIKKDMYVVYIVRAIDKQENNVMTKVPNIGDKELNVINGNSDYRILCQKVGKNYIRRAVLKRKNYERDKIDDERILNILDTVSGAFERSRKTSKEEQERIVKEQEKQQEAERIMRQRERDAELKGGDDNSKKETKTEDKQEVEQQTKQDEQPKRRRRRRRVANE